MATAKPSQPFEGLRCPHCGDIDTISVKLDTLAMECGECSEPVTRAEVDAMIARWTALFGWLDSAAKFAPK
jgi:hypothetical protein